MTVDIIIPTYKPDETLCLLLQKLQEQTFVIHRVILLNTEQKLWEQSLLHYPIKEALENLPCDYRVIHIAKAEFDHGATRQLGAQSSDADFFIFMTQDAVPKDKFLVEKLLSPLQEKGTAAAVSYARQLAREDCRIAEKYTRKFNYPPESCLKTKEDIDRLGIKTFFCSDVCAAYRKDIFDALGGFEFPVIFNEDMFFAAKAIEHGYAVAYAADAKVIHSHNYSMMQQFRRNFDLAVSQKQHPEIFENISSEKEGIRLVKSTVRYLFRIKKPWLIFHFGTQCAGKYAGYFLGKRYEKLSRNVILKCTMNRDYWLQQDRCSAKKR